MTPKQQKEAADAAAKKAADEAAAAKQKALDDAAHAQKSNLDAIAGSLTNLTTQIAQLGGRVDILAQERTNRGEPAAPATGSTRTVSQADIDKAYDEGDYKRAGQLQSTFNAETMNEILAGINTKITGLEQQGVTMIADVVKQQQAAGLPYYSKYKTEIDEFLQKVPASARTQPEMYKWAHDAIVGRHTADIVKEEVEKEIRKRMDGGGGYVPGSGGGEGHETNDGKLTIDSVYEGDAEGIKRLLRSKKITMTEYAARRGYPDEQSYLTYVKKFRAEEQARMDGTN